MSGLKREVPGLRFGAMGTNPPVNQITPDEIDMYKQYVVAFPGWTVQSWFFLGSSGTADVTAITPLNFATDYPRTIEFSITGSSAGQGGSVDINGRNQFGETISETIGITPASNGGTTNGTKVFAQITSGTVRYGTFAGVNGTTRVGMGTLGSVVLFGLPDRLGATTDVKSITFNNGTGAVIVNKGSIGAFINKAQSAIQSPFNVIGTTLISVLYKSTYNAENIGVSANLPQIT